MTTRRNPEWEKEDADWYEGYYAAKSAERETRMYEQLRAPRTFRAHEWTIAVAMVAAVVIFGAWLYPDIAGSPVRSEPTKTGAQGNQAPPAAVRRGPAAQTQSVQSQIDAYNQQQEAGVQAPIQSAAPEPLPLNSAGEPVIDAAQQQQMQLSLQLAEQEANAAADAQLAAQRAAADAAALSRPPDLTYEEAKALLGRDPCSVPRANPHTCAQGLFKPTPVN